VAAKAPRPNANANALANIEADFVWCRVVLVLVSGVGAWLSLTTAQAQTEAQAWALGAVAEAIIAAEKCPLLRYNSTAGALLLAAARIEPKQPPYRLMLEKRIMGERFSWDTNPDPFACEQPMLRRMRLVIER
jgi:hypothetical protein